jgi:hypothetical protein
VCRKVRPGSILKLAMPTSVFAFAGAEKVPRSELWSVNPTARLEKSFPVFIADQSRGHAAACGAVS